MLWRGTVCSGGRQYALESDSMLWRVTVCSGGRQYALEDGSRLWRAVVMSEEPWVLGRAVASLGEKWRP